MKIIIPLIAMFALLSACTHEGNLYKSAEKRIANCITSENYTVPVREGYATYVRYGEDTVAIATKPMIIQIPKGMIVTKGSAEEAITLEYEVLANQQTYSKSWQAVMFEDTQAGDYDYNDFIFHVRNMHSQNKLHIDIQPIALGSQKVIKLGCMIINDKTEHILSEDVRKDFFGGRKGFINTESDKEVVRYKLERRLTHVLEKGRDEYATLAWFIEVDGQRYFAVNADLDYREYDLLNTQGMPFGLVVYGLNGKNGTFAYAEEKISLFDAYPNFKAWIDGESATFGKPINSMIYKYNYEKIPGTSSRIWDWSDLK